MPRVLVTGGTGLVGRYLVEDLLSKGYEVVVASRNSPAPESFSKHVTHCAFVLDPELDQTGIFQGVDFLIHAAFNHIAGRYRGGEGDDPAGFRRANLDGTIRLFLTARDCGVRRVVFLSSRAVYDGAPAGSLLREDQILQPTSLYGQIKLEAERGLSALSDARFSAASLRVTGVYGDLLPNKWDSLFAAFKAGNPIAARAASEVHGRDVGAATRLMLEAQTDKISGQVFNVSDLVTDTREILSLYQAAAGISGQPLPERGDHAAVSRMDVTRLEKLGWRPGGRNLLESTIAKIAHIAAN